MKKILLVVIVAILTTGAYAQFTKGNILVGGSTQAGLNFSTNKFKSGGNTTTDSKTTVFNVQPQAGYFLADNILVGSGVDISLLSSKDEGSSAKFTSTSFTLSPFARYYFSGLYGQVGLALGTQKTKNTNGTGTTNESTDNITGLNLAIGYPILLNESVSLEPQLGYQTVTFKDTDTDIKSTSGGIFLSIGIYGYLGSLGKK